MNMWAIFVVLLACSVGWADSDPAVNGRSVFTSNGAEADKTKLYIQSDFGTPIQVLKSRLILNDGDPNPQLINKRTCTTGFDPSASTTFNWTSSFPGGVYGTDTIIFGDPVVQPNTPFRILNDNCTADNSFISLRPGRGQNDFTFVADYVTKQSNPVAVLHFENIGANGSLPTNGSLTLSGVTNDICTDDWTYIDSQKLDGYESWAIEVIQLSYNKDFLKSPVKAKLSIDDYNIYIPEPYFTKLSKQLRISTDGFIPCDVNPNNIISFNVNGSYIRIGPNEYLDHSTVAKYNACKSRIICQDPKLEYFTLPVTIFRNYCLLLDYKYRQIGVTLTTAAQGKGLAGTASFVRVNQ